MYAAVDGHVEDGLFATILIVQFDDIICQWEDRRVRLFTSSLFIDLEASRSGLDEKSPVLQSSLSS